jgi:hypothetical protein
MRPSHGSPTPRQLSNTVVLAYLERDGVERDGSPGRLYGPHEEFNAEAFRAPLVRIPANVITQIGGS